PRSSWSPSLSFSHVPSHTGPYTLSLHDALPILLWLPLPAALKISVAKSHDPPGNASSVTSASSTPSPVVPALLSTVTGAAGPFIDRKSTRLNSSHVKISYAVFCLKKKKTTSRTR